MGNRRMFSKAVLRSDDFLNISLSAQLLYIQLSLEADDDGILDNITAIKRIVGATDENYQELVDNNLIIDFGNSIIALTHWNVNNLIQKDRYKATIYQKEKSELILNENKVYTRCIRNVSKSDTKNKNCIQSVSNLDTQDKLSKVNLSKDNIYSQTVSAFNSICTSLSSVRTISETRKKHINSFIDTLKKHDLTVDDYFKKVQASDFLTGRNKAWCNCSFDWLIKQSNTIKVCEGNYDNKSNSDDEYIY